MKNKENIKVCLVGSSGGHLTHLLYVKAILEKQGSFLGNF